ncbi:MAG: 30S ribosomal protein S16 [Proteobacteria bacterium]|nr:30S ribosomal protein S16 [Pseudomonadota bacterium]
MAARMRLKRMGAKKHPFYRVVVTDSGSPRDGRFVEEVGTYDPLQDPPTVSFKAERIRHWLSQGVEPSDTVRSLLQRAGLWGEADRDESDAA